MAESTKIDRRTTTPFLLRLFYRSGSFHRLEDFSPNAPLPPHVQIYTWQSCSLKELTHLITSALPSLFPSPFIGTRLCFRLIYADTSQQVRQGPGRYSLTEIGTVVIGADSDDQADNGLDVKKITEHLEGDMDKTLQDARFVIGDYVSCAILPPLANGDVAPPPARGPPPRAQNAPPRQNGFGSDFGGYGARRGGGGRFEGGDRRAPAALPPGEWRRGDIPPQGSAGNFAPRGRGRGRGW